jgi:hypothetical protein
MKISYPCYSVVTTEGTFIENGMQSNETFFNDPDLLKARSKAIQFAKELERKANEFDDPKYVHEIPVLIPMLTAFSVNVLFCKDETESDIIYGESLEDNSFGLYVESMYFKRNYPSSKVEFVKLFWNNNPDDDTYPPYQIAINAKQLPEFDFEILEVLAQDLDTILPLEDESQAYF